MQVFSFIIFFNCFLFISQVNCQRKCPRGGGTVVCLPNTTAADMLEAIYEIQQIQHNDVTSILCYTCGVSDVVQVLDENTTTVVGIEWQDTQIIKNFHKIPNLKKIYLKNNDITEFEAKDFENLSKMEDFGISKNKIPFLPEDLFKHMPNVKIISFYSIGLQKLGKNMFKNLPDLEVLVMTNNNLYFLDPELLKENVNLRTLQIDHNKITSIPEGFFNNLKQLEQVDISYNPIVSLDMGSLFKHPTLNGLWFERIPCSTLERKVYPYLNLVSTNLYTDHCNTVLCLFLKRENLPTITLKNFGTYEEYNVPGNWLEKIVQYIPCVDYCSVESKFIKSENSTAIDELSMFFKNDVQILEETLKYLMDNHIFAIESRAALSTISDIMDTLKI